MVKLPYIAAMFLAARVHLVLAGILFLVVAGVLPLCAVERLDWRATDNRVSAEFTSAALVPVLEQIAGSSGWQIYVEPGTRRQVSTKFKDRTIGEALRLLLGELSYVRVPPETNGPAKLFVFRTSRDEATQLIRPIAKKLDPTARPIPNELVVKLKRGAKIDDLAKRFGAKVLGRADGVDTYRLSFDSPEAAQAAREQLAASPDVEGVDSNYWVQRPETSDAMNFAANSSLNLKPRAAGDCSNPIIGLIDTALQPTGTPMDAFLLPSISVAGEVKPNPSQPPHATPMFTGIMAGLARNDTQTSAKVLPVDVYGPNSTTTTFDVANGIVQAINKGATVINMSLGSGGDSDFLRGVIKSGAGQGVLFLAAAGNEPVTTPTYPAAYPQVLAVTASGRDGKIAPYANRGDFIDISAPGSAVFPYQGQSWMVMGTSPATAYASGVAAGLWDCNKMTTAQIKAAMEQLLPVKR